MTIRVSLIVVFSLCQIFVACAPFLPFIDGLYLDAPTPRDQLNQILVHLGIHFTILAAFIGIFFTIEKKNVEQIVPKIEARLSRPSVQRIRDDDFYRRFLALAQNARDYVYICYFAPYAPEDVPNRQQRDYYDDLRKAINRRTEVTFRRIVRRTSKTEPWIVQLVRDMDGKANASLAALSDSGADEMPIALSVQVIDGHHAWIVATVSHQRTEQYRDLYIENDAVAAEFAAYHKRLWEKGVVLVESGRITEDGRTLVQLLDDVHGRQQ